jgi:hypothetical protein
LYVVAVQGWRQHCQVSLIRPTSKKSQLIKKNIRQFDDTNKEGARVIDKLPSIAKLKAYKFQNQSHNPKFFQSINLLTFQT